MQVYVSSFVSQASRAAICLPHWKTVDDMVFWTLYLESISSKGMHACLAHAGWKYASNAAKNNITEADEEE